MDMQNVAKLNIPEGEVRTIHDKNGNLIWGKVSYGIKYKGDTTQNGTPTPSTPVAVQTVTGEQTISINGAAHTVNLGFIELCKIGAYQDYIYKSGGKWYVHKEIEHTTIDGSIDWWYGSNSFTSQTNISGMKLDSYVESGPIIIMSDQFLGQNWWSVGHGLVNNSISSHNTNQGQLKIYSTTITSANDMKTHLTSSPMAIYYVLATPTDTEITNETLVAQLEAVEQWLARYGYNATVSGNLPIIIDRTTL